MKVVLFFSLFVSLFAWIVSPSSLQLIDDRPKWGEGDFKPNPEFNPIIRLADEDGHPFCSATVVDPHYAVTAAHCLYNQYLKMKSMVVKIYDDEGKDTHVKATPAGIAIRSDLGIILGNFSNFHPLKAEVSYFGFLTKGPFVSCGYPYGQKKMVCIPFAPKTNKGFYVAGSGYLVPGMSGGPVIDITTSTVVAVNSAVGDEEVYVSPIQGLLGAFSLD